jgi:thermostable 8-oxoguanine DNA glycosylase
MIKDPNILLSVINTKLRDQYSSLDELCDDLDYSKEEIVEILSNNGFFYDSNKNQFIQK